MALLKLATMNIFTGNGTGLLIWATVSSPLFELLWEEGFFSLLIGAISGQSCKLAGFMFAVDNMDLIVWTQATSQWRWHYTCKLQWPHGKSCS